MTSIARAPDDELEDIDVRGVEADADVEEADADPVVVDGDEDEVRDLIDGVVAAVVDVFGLFAKGLCNSTSGVFPCLKSCSARRCASALVFTPDIIARRSD